MSFIGSSGYAFTEGDGALICHTTLYDGVCHIICFKDSFVCRFRRSYRSAFTVFKEVLGGVKQVGSQEILVIVLALTSVVVGMCVGRKLFLPRSVGVVLIVCAFVIRIGDLTQLALMVAVMLFIRIVLNIAITSEIMEWITQVPIGVLSIATGLSLGLGYGILFRTNEKGIK